MGERELEIDSLSTTIDSIGKTMQLVDEEFQAKLNLMGLEYTGLGFWLREGHKPAMVMVPDDDNKWFVQIGVQGSLVNTSIDSAEEVFAYLYDYFYNQETE